MLSPSKGQVAYALLTRSPLKIEPKLNFPFDLHVLGTPPARIKLSNIPIEEPIGS